MNNKNIVIFAMAIAAGLQGRASALLPEAGFQPSSESQAAGTAPADSLLPSTKIATTSSTIEKPGAHQRVSVPQAEESARRFMGDLLPASATARATLAAARSHPSPLCREGQEIFEVKFSGVLISLPSGRDLFSSVVRDVAVTVDCGSASVLRCSLSDVQRVSLAPPEPCGSSATDQFRGMGPETWLRCSTPSEVPLSTALRMVEIQGLGSPRAAASIVVYCVVSEFANRPATTVWSIDLRGIEAPKATPVMATNLRNHLRHLVDAGSGKWICALSSPQPDRQLMESKPLPAPNAPPTQGVPAESPSHSH